jgi:subtilisin family serine protease
VRKGAVVIAAAGNSGTTTPFYPAADANSLSVAATTPGDLAYSWSNYGQWVDVAAPGCNLAPIRGGGVGNFCGTSSATPVVAGLVALARSLQASAAPAAIMDAVERTAAPLPNVVRYGRVNAAEALGRLRAAPAAPARATATFKGVLDARHRVRAYVVASGSGPIELTLRFRGAARLALSANGSGVSGPSPLRLRAQSTGGLVKLVVRGSARKTRFALTASYPPRR